ncbi:DUF1015 family protein [Oxyplasma meridianum]|uniref:DUF1015 family protein n=1 Tax=Oxyplasma meridianum TaxID=3073602 RepID=A0AAX4NH02_9ARCH
MVKIRPFNPLYYSGDYGRATSPPFDSINKEEEKRLKEYRNNITYLTLPEGNNYAESRKRIREWIDTGILVEWKKPCFVIVDQSFRFREHTLRRTGLISLVDIFPDDSSINPHEKTFPGPVQERVKVLGELKAQPEPIFLTLENYGLEPLLQGIIIGRKENFSFTDGNGSLNSVYFIDNNDEINKITNLLKLDSAMVADGHHRLEASKKLASESHGVEKSFWSSVMAYITSMESPGLLVSGIHRIVKTKIDKDRFLEKAIKYFIIDENPPDSGNDFITLFIDRFYYLSPSHCEFSEDMDQSYLSPIHILNNIIFREILRLDPGNINRDMEFTHDADYAVEQVRKGMACAAFIMPVWDREKLFSLVLSEGVLPQKSTYFHPKIYSGIVLRSL